jgi:hypothetical protein
MVVHRVAFTAVQETIASTLAGNILREYTNLERRVQLCMDTDSDHV